MRSDNAVLLLQLLPRIVFVLRLGWLWVAVMLLSTPFTLQDLNSPSPQDRLVSSRALPDIGDCICDHLRLRCEQFMLNVRSSWERTIHTIPICGFCLFVTSKIFLGGGLLGEKSVNTSPLGSSCNKADLSTIFIDLHQKG